MNKPIDQTHTLAQANASSAGKPGMKMIAHDVWQLNAHPPDRINTYLVEGVLSLPVC